MFYKKITLLRQYWFLHFESLDTALGPSGKNYLNRLNLDVNVLLFQSIKIQLKGSSLSFFLHKFLLHFINTVDFHDFWIFIRENVFFGI